mmetsp:Transcript_32347/g.46923  ORF Transcript_32347/g.46923 Transcript_32347/m.46923 type:complete len:93 (-) Transcript_32347:1821-2099(-)
MYKKAVSYKKNKRKKRHYSKVVGKLIPIFKKATAPFVFDRYEPSRDLGRVRAWIQKLFIVLQTSDELNHVLADFEQGGKIHKVKDRAADVAL